MVQTRISKLDFGYELLVYYFITIILCIFIILTIKCEKFINKYMLSHILVVRSNDTTRTMKSNMPKALSLCFCFDLIYDYDETLYQQWKLIKIIFIALYIFLIFCNYYIFHELTELLTNIIIFIDNYNVNNLYIYYYTCMYNTCYAHCLFTPLILRGSYSMIYFLVCEGVSVYLLCTCIFVCQYALEILLRIPTLSLTAHDNRVATYFRFSHYLSYSIFHLLRIKITPCRSSIRKNSVTNRVEHINKVE